MFRACAAVLALTTALLAPGTAAADQLVICVRTGNTYIACI